MRLLTGALPSTAPCPTTAPVQQGRSGAGSGRLNWPELALRSSSESVAEGYELGFVARSNGPALLQAIPPSGHRKEPGWLDRRLQ